MAIVHLFRRVWHPAGVLLIAHFGTSKGNALDASDARASRVQGGQGRQSASQTVALRSQEKWWKNDGNKIWRLPNGSIHFSSSKSLSLFFLEATRVATGNPQVIHCRRPGLRPPVKRRIIPSCSRSPRRSSMKGCRAWKALKKPPLWMEDPMVRQRLVDGWMYTDTGIYIYI